MAGDEATGEGWLKMGADGVTAGDKTITAATARSIRAAFKGKIFKEGRTQKVTLTLPGSSRGASQVVLELTTGKDFKEVRRGVSATDVFFTAETVGKIADAVEAKLAADKGGLGVLRSVDAPSGSAFNQSFKTPSNKGR